MGAKAADRSTSQTEKKSFQYQWEEFIDNSIPKKNISEWNSSFGPLVIDRTKKGIAKNVKFQILVDNKNVEVYLAGAFNDWGKDETKLKNFQLEPDEHHVFFSIITDKLKHQDTYKFIVIENGGKKYLPDPAGVYFDVDGNTVFWDFEDPSTYKPKHEKIDTINRATRIIQTDLPGLIYHWKSKDGELGHEIDEFQYYNFISDSGVLEHVKELGFNTIQFLPFAQSIDGDNWKFRYLVPYQFAIQNNWGTPDDFARMIDRCHELGLAVIGDFIISHFPFKDYNIFGQHCNEVGIHLWKKSNGYELYMKEETPWGTMRVDYDSPHVRDFVIASCLHFMKYYRVDGYRIDNVDGILRFWENGDGPERPYGRTFLRGLCQTLYDYNPFALVHLESHYFFEDNAKMLVIPFDQDPRAIGATAYNSSRTTYYFHTEYMPKDAKRITPWKFRDIAEEKEWGQSNSTVADFHNHDAAAGLMEMRCTGSYAYDTMTCKDPQNHPHALGKIKIMESFISFGMEGRTLDLLQTFLLQTGTFEHDSGIHWQLTFNEVSKNCVAYKAAVNKLMDDPAFWPMFTKNRKWLNVDDVGKVIVIERSAEYKGKTTRYVIVINLSSWPHHNYKVGVRTENDFEVVLNSDLFAYAGSGQATYAPVLANSPSQNFELLSRELELPMIAAYQTLVLREIQK